MTATTIRTASLAVATGLLLAMTAGANAQVTRSTSTTGPAGNTVSKDATAQCAGGTCTSNKTVTGPRGNTASKSGTTTCAGGKCSGGSTTTGPAGNTLKRTRSTTIN
jgi:uncharacterized low-complexity protein